MTSRAGVIIGTEYNVVNKDYVVICFRKISVVQLVWWGFCYKFVFIVSIVG